MFANRQRAKNANRLYIVCTGFSSQGDGTPLITPPMDVCDRYTDRSFVSLYTMKEIAWVINNDPKKKIGFLRPEDMKDEFGHNKELRDLEDKLPHPLRKL